MVSSLYSHNLHTQFYCVLPVFTLTKLVLMASFCAAIKKHSFSLLRFIFLSHVWVFSYQILLVCRLKYPYSCFSSNFYFLLIVVLLIFMLSVLFLFAVISLSLFFLMSSSNLRIDEPSLSSTSASFFFFFFF